VWVHGIMSLMLALVAARLWWHICRQKEENIHFHEVQFHWLVLVSLSATTIAESFALEAPEAKHRRNLPLLHGPVAL